MRNPLNKRILRELKNDFGKYIVIFLFLTLTIGFVSGFLVAGGSMVKAYNDSFEKYNIEYGHFSVDNKLSEDVLIELEKNHVKIDELHYKDIETDTNLDGKNNSTLRVYVDRKNMNKVCVMDGKLPSNDNQIAIDRMYADNNGVTIGDDIDVGGQKRKVTGLVALSDYSALFSDNTDMMFDAVKFGVGIVTKDGFASLNHKIIYNYSWRYDKKPADDLEEKKMSDAFMKKVSQNTNVNTYVPRYENMAIQFTGDDLGGDRNMMIILLYILIMILSFVFVVTIHHTISKEASVIGTLRASGYSKKELVIHYISTPLLVSLIAALAGNILGYTVFKKIVVSMYYGSYSLPTYETIWNSEAFILTTIVPVLILFITNFIALIYKLSLSPLRFLRCDLSKKKNKKAVKLPNIGFLGRFTIRIILQNKAGYITLFVGIIFANILLLFGMMMSPLLAKYQGDIVDNMISNYQYVLKTPITIDDTKAEQFCMSGLKIDNESNGEEISIYGIKDNSNYFEKNVSEGIYVSKGLSEKYGYKIGDTITLHENFGTKEYKFKIKGFVYYPASLSVFMSQQKFNETFGLNERFFNGYFSDEKLKLQEELVAKCITKDDLTKTSRQLNVSMGKMFYMVNVFAVVLFVLLIYLLTKLIIEKNATSISMIKILGYNNKEIAKLYILATTCVVVISIIISLFASTYLIDLIYYQMMKGYSGWLTFYIKPLIYVEMFFIGMISYGFVALLQLRKIKRIPMNIALKNIE